MLDLTSKNFLNVSYLKEVIDNHSVTLTKEELNELKDSNILTFTKLRSIVLNKESFEMINKESSSISLDL